jgi:hypothetical protein
VIEERVKSVMIPYLENYDYSRYIVKLDSVLVDVLKNSTLDNKTMLLNFKNLMLPVETKEIKASELFKIWSKHVAKEVDTDGLEIDYDDEPSYRPVDISLSVDYADKRNWSLFEYATLVFECEHDDKVNFAIGISKWDKDKKNEWSISRYRTADIDSLRHLNEFEILLMRLNQAGTKLIMDTDNESDEVTPENKPEAKYE